VLGKSVRLVTLAALSVAGSVGCTPGQYAGQADRAAYRAMAAGQAASLGQSEPFDIKYKPFRATGGDARERIVVGRKVIPIGGGHPVMLTLDECLTIAFGNSRQLQDEKENVYSLALNLANVRRGWDGPLFTAGLSGDVGVTKVDKGAQDNTASAVLGPSIVQKFVDGGVLTLAAAVDWSTDFISGGGGDNLVNSLLEANFTQPLLRGAWRGLAYEDQYRLERDFLFAVFDYTRFRQTFAAEVYGRYYSVLRRRDQLENEKISVQHQEITLAMTKVQVEGGMLTRVDQDRAEQAMLNAKIRYQENKQSYQNALDSFKILIGLPVAACMELDYPTALRDLAKAGAKPVGFKEAEAVQIALAVRPDVLSAKAKVRDAARDVEIAADNFLPQIDVELGVSAVGTPPRGFQDVRFDRHTRFARATFNYQFDQTDNRDAYRLAVIAHDKSKRDLAEFVDHVILDVRTAYRELTQSEQSYELQDRSVQVARRRHRLAQLQQQQGELSPTDVLDAEDDLRRAENGRTSALVSYNNTRVRFLADLGMIDVDEKGGIHERTKPFEFNRIGHLYPYVAQH